MLKERIEDEVRPSSTMKPPEEGQIWEWRAFGQLSQGLAARIQSYPVRFGITSQSGEDIYLVSGTSDQNVKLRKWGGEWLLKFKLLLATEPRSIELYRESSDHVYGFPVGAEKLSEAARLLEVKVAEPEDYPELLSRDEFIQALVSSSPAVASVKVAKVRTQFMVRGGWLELAQVTFPRHSVQSVSIHSYELEVLKRILDRLQPDAELEAMNYIEACRRWM